MSLCDCKWRPWCDTRRNCETYGDVLVWEEQRSRIPRPRFMCRECFDAINEARKRKIPGLDPPEGASDFWKPSLTEMIRLADLELRRQKRIKEDLEGPQRQAEWPERPLLNREKQLSPAQWGQILIFRRALRAASSGNH